MVCYQAQLVMEKIILRNFFIKYHTTVLESP